MAHTTHASRTRILLTSGPTWEPIDAVRYLGNRSTGKLGASIADAAADLGADVTLLLGPQAAEPVHTGVTVTRFQTTADLQALLAEHAPHCDVLIMAAAVADYRPLPDPAVKASGGKLRRKPSEIILRLTATPDLIAAEAARKRPDQLFIAFALEPRDRLIASAEHKLERKGVDAIVANPLETMGADAIEAVYISTIGAHTNESKSRTDTTGAHDQPARARTATDGPIAKSDFAAWLLNLIFSDLSRLREET